MTAIQKRVTYTIDEANEILLQTANKEKPRYGLFDVILILLYADKDIPIYGRTRIMKEIFLACEQLFNKEEVEQIIFVRHKYGPYNEDIENIIDDMIFSSYVEYGKTKNKDNDSIKIADKGIRYIAKKFAGLPEDLQRLIKIKRMRWDSKPIHYLLKYVYTTYPDYLENAVLRKRFSNIYRWERKEKQ